MTVTIGQLTNVPAPGDPIKSNWPQSISHLVQEILTLQKLRITAPGDATLSSTDQGLQLGPTSGINMILDNAEIQVRNNGAFGSLTLNESGGAVNCGAAITAGTNITAGQDLVATQSVTAGGSVTATSNVISGATPDPAGNVPGSLIAPAGLIKSYLNNSTTASISLTRAGTGDATNQQFMRFGRTTSDTGIGSITIASATAVAFNTTSDPRLKDNLGPITDAALRIQQLGSKAFRGRWKADLGEGEEWDMLSSHDIEDVAPYSVYGERDATRADDGEIVGQQVDYSSLVPLLVAALADALDRIDALEGLT